VASLDVGEGAVQFSVWQVTCLYYRLGKERQLVYLLLLHSADVPNGSILQGRLKCCVWEKVVFVKVVLADGAHAVTD